MMKLMHFGLRSAVDVDIVRIGASLITSAELLVPKRYLIAV